MIYYVNGKQRDKTLFMHWLIRCCKMEVIMNCYDEYYKNVSFSDLKEQYLNELLNGFIVSFPSQKMEFKINAK